MMTRASILAAAVALLSATNAMVAQTATVDDIVAKNIQAKGGLEKLHSIDTIKQTSQFTMQGGQASVVIYNKRPNLMRQEMTVGGQRIINAFDGTTPWIINPLAGVRTPIVVTGPQADAIREQADFDGTLVDYKTKGYRVDLVGTETANGHPVNHLRVTGKTGDAQDWYLDADTGLESRITSQTPSGTFEQDLADYREVDGVRMPFSIRTLFNGVPEVTIQVKTVEFNVPVDDGLFKIPQQ